MLPLMITKHVFPSLSLPASPVTNLFRHLRLMRNSGDRSKGDIRDFSFGLIAMALAMIGTASSSLWSATTSGAAATAQFVNIDTTTQGNWLGAYGRDGSVLVNNSANYPSYAVVTGMGAAKAWTWAASTSDPRALRKPLVVDDRIASALLTTSTFSIDMNLTDGNSHQLAIYCLDWNGQGRAERIDILDAVSAAVLDSRDVASFSQTPQYVIWNIRGHVSIKVTWTAGTNAAISGFFFDPLASRSSVTVNVSPTSASLNQGQSATFTSTVTGANNTGVTWQLSPLIGTITNGVYQAPPVIVSQQTVTITATSVADSLVTASATVSLQPVAVTVGPASASLAPGQSTTFTASV